jgi:hypothetical protein
LTLTPIAMALFARSREIVRTRNRVPLLRVEQPFAVN